MSKARAFEKVFTAGDETGLTLRKACQIAKSAPFAGVVLDLTPQRVTGEDFRPRVISGGDWWDEDDREQALQKLAEIGRKMAPTATPEKQFAVAFEHPANASLAQRAHVRPRATTYYEFPR